MLNVTGLQPIVTDFELMFFTLLYILSWIGIIVLLVIIVVLAIRLIGKTTKLPVDKILELAGALLEQNIKRIKVKNNSQKPFVLSMFGITIMADGTAGKIIFVALLGSIVAAIGNLIVIGFEDFNPIPNNWY